MRRFLRWWVNGGPTDILAFWTTVGLIWLCLDGEAERIPTWVLFGWAAVVALWIFYRIVSHADKVSHRLLFELDDENEVSVHEPD